MGIGRGFSGKGKINTIRFIKDLLGAAGLGASAFKNGHDTKLIDIAVEAVKGNAGADNKPVVETVDAVTWVKYVDNDEKRIITRTPGVSSNSLKDSVVTTKGVVDTLYTERFDNTYDVFIKLEGSGDYEPVK